jgi:predicted Zn finger-like uncharacterized protein
MLILCPSCEASYDVPDERMRPGRKVRCAQCGAEWIPVPVPPEQEVPDAVEGMTSPDSDEYAADDADLGPPPAPVATGMARLTMGPASGQGRAALRAAWIASVVLLVAAIGAGYALRDQFMQMWPPSARVYDALGLRPG